MSKSNVIGPAIGLTPPVGSRFPMINVGVERIPKGVITESGVWDG